MSDGLAQAVRAALNGMTVTGPRAVVPLAQAFASPGVDVNEAAIRARVAAGDPNDEIVHQFQLSLAQWDSEADAPWANGTPVRTRERRAVAYGLLGLDSESAAVFDDRVPARVDETVVISEEWDPWYTASVRAKRDFYWSRYRRYLGDTKRWPGDAISSLDDATTHVVERLADPVRREAFQARGLVVGYVQSGKTANFTGVIAKAVDAGYRLVIVLTGTVELLRAQTQRRLDMELVGRENLLRGVDESDSALMSDFDYADDEDWRAGRFLRLGFLPSDHGHPDIIRLTERRFDYKRLRTAISALEFERHDRTRSLLDPANLHRSSARLVVVKKNAAVLKRLVTDLKSIKPKLGELPALLIDDESDQASINTNDPAKARKAIEEGRPARTAINRLISELLGLLPRAQYVGYTATPFANVFIDPSDAADLFPKHFLVSLERPPGYMGVGDFHDIDLALEPSERTVANSNEKAYVRGVRGRDEDERERELRSAIDAFVLSGALKLYRETQGPRRFKHHTMLVHESVRMVEHRALADQVRDLWNSGGYSQPSGFARLRELWDSDYAEVCAARADGEAVPASFDEIKPFVPTVVARVTEQGPPVLIVNGDNEVQQAKLDFDRGPVWRILVGGTKLSRGFTVEGLTVSYYRRRTQAADTLMQMGRWFGFRDGYRDLVRLYVGRNEPDGRHGSVDLYDAFEAIVRDEESFRNELKRYARKTDDGRPQVTPREIPPLVTQHLPWLTPTSRNKMFNAKLVVRRWAGTWFEPTAYPLDEPSKRKNFDAVRPVLAAATEAFELTHPATAGAGAGTFPALLGLLDATTLLDVIRDLRWLTPDYFKPDLTYFAEITETGRVEDWLVVMPQLVTAAERDLPEVGSRRVVQRRRRAGRGGMFGAISDPKHRPPVLRVADAHEDYGDAVLESYVTERRGGLLVYVVADVPFGELAEEPDPGDLVVTLTFVAPRSAAPTSKIVGFVSKDSSAEDAVVIDA